MIKQSLLAGVIAAVVGFFIGANSSRGEANSAVPVTGGAAPIGPENTRLQFVCAHIGAKPDPRKGGFGKFVGKVQVDSTTKSLKAVWLDIDTNSLWTEFDMLTTHLKSPDFFEVRRFPTAKFESTKIEPAAITGKLTLHGVTKEITIPATITVSDAGVRISSDFTINRLDYGINFDPKKVEDKVALTIVVGEKQ